MSAVIRIRTDEGCRVALLCREGRTKAHLVWIESSGVKASAEPLEVLRKVAYIQQPTKRAARRMLAAGRKLGITKGARAMLKAVIDNATD